MREVRLDISASDSANRKINVEFQRDNSGAVPERARYNSSMIDVNSLKKGRNFTELPEVYVIFITEHDVLGYGLPLYMIDRVIRENNKPFGDRAHIVYVNCANQDADTALGKLVHDFLCRDSGDKYCYDVLGARISYLKDEQEGVKNMSAIVREYAEGLVKEQQKTIAERMIEAGKLALKEIAEYTGLSLSAVKQLAKKLEESRA